MADFKLISDNGILWDWTTEGDDLATDDGLSESVLCSLGFDRRVSEDELPDGEDNRRGTWMDEFEPAGDGGIGSKLWLLARSKPTPAVLPRAEEFAKEALSWMIEDQVASLIEITASFGTIEGLDGVALLLSGEVHRPQVGKASFKFGVLWDQLAQAS